MTESTSHPVPQPSASCPECGGECVPTVARVGTKAVYLQLPGPFIRGVTSVRALSCTRCGLTRFYAETPVVLAQKQE